LSTSLLKCLVVNGKWVYHLAKKWLFCFCFVYLIKCQNISDIKWNVWGIHKNKRTLFLHELTRWMRLNEVKIIWKNYMKCTCYLQKHEPNVTETSVIYIHCNKIYEILFKLFSCFHLGIVSFVNPFVIPYIVNVLFKMFLNAGFIVYFTYFVRSY
jgi:hypothetical protein